MSESFLLCLFCVSFWCWDLHSQKHCSAWFLPLIFGRLNPAHSVIPNPSHQNSSAKETCQNLCQKGWISYKGHCYLVKKEWHGPKLRYWLLQNRSIHNFFSTAHSCLSCTWLFSSLSASPFVYRCWPKVPDIQLSAAGEVCCSLPRHRTHSSSNEPTSVWNLDLLELWLLSHVILPPLLCRGFWTWGLSTSCGKIRHI